MAKKKVILVGYIRLGHPPVDGETTKNQFIIKELGKYCDVIPLDFYEKNKHPWIYLQALWAFISHPDASVILSTTAKNVYSLLKIFKAFGVKRNFVHWIIGGCFDQMVKDGIYDAEVLNYLSFNLAQCHSMVDVLKECGVTNAKFVSNFKDIPYYPSIDTKLENLENGKVDVYRFVFLSRIMKKKGVNYILEAVRRLNAEGYGKRFIVDLYGKMDLTYKEEFENDSSRLDNVKYHGLLNLRSNEGYDVLSSYHAMLFPTYHPSEGIAGVIIDAYIAGVPVIASDWAHNRESVIDGKTGIIIPTHDVDALVDKMRDVIDNKIDLVCLSKNAQKEAHSYEAENVITEDYLRSIELI